MPSLHKVAAITGIGETEYTKSSGMGDKALQLQAIMRAIEDAGLTPQDIDGFIPSSVGPGLAAEHFIDALGIKDLRYTATLFMGGASGVGGLQSAAMAIAAGVARNVVVVSGRNGSSMHRISQAQAARGMAPPRPQQGVFLEFEAPYGAMVPSQFYAMIARRHMHVYGTTSLQMGAVAVTERKHAMLNPKAVMRTPITLADHQASRMVTDPFHLFDCSIETDGAAAILLSGADAARGMRHRPVHILGIAEGHPDSPSSVATRPDLLKAGMHKSAPRAFAMAGVHPRDIRLAELYDPFSFMVIFALEALRFCDPGEGGPFVASGHIEIGGKLPVNTHGGLLSQAHSMSGLNHVAEAVKQLRGQAGQAQVKSPDPCVVTGFGDFGNGSVAVLSR